MIWMELMFGFTVVGWAVWQLVDLRREKKKDEAKRVASQSSFVRAVDDAGSPPARE